MNINEQFKEAYKGRKGLRSMSTSKYVWGMHVKMTSDPRDRLVAVVDWLLSNESALCGSPPPRPSLLDSPKKRAHSDDKYSPSADFVHSSPSRESFNHSSPDGCPLVDKSAPAIL